MQKYRLLAKKGEGTFSEVLKAEHVRTGRLVAMKCMKASFASLDDVNALREVQALRRLAGHPHIVTLHEVLYDTETHRMAMVFELMDMNLYEAIRGRRHYLPEERVAQWMYELLQALDYMHSKGVFHRDIKPENLLIQDNILKVADLGSCKGTYAKQPFTEYISTRWYRSPECLLTDGYYGGKMDVWGVGCVFFELMCLQPLFPGQDESDQIDKIHSVLGTPDEVVIKKMQKYSRDPIAFTHVNGCGLESVMVHGSKHLLNLLKELLAYDPDDRLTATKAVRSDYFLRYLDTQSYVAHNELKQSKHVTKAVSITASNMTTVNLSKATNGTRKEVDGPAGFKFRTPVVASQASDSGVIGQKLVMALKTKSTSNATTKPYLRKKTGHLLGRT